MFGFLFLSIYAQDHNNALLAFDFAFTNTQLLSALLNKSCHKLFILYNIPRFLFECGKYFHTLSISIGTNEYSMQSAMSTH